MIDEPEAFVVLWRAAPQSRWQVQPFVYGAADADQVGAKLMERFGGEAWLAPIEPPPRGEVPRDLEEHP